MKKWKMCRAIVALGLVASLASVSLAGRAYKPKGGDPGTYFENLDFLGVRAYTLDLTIAPEQIVSNDAGLLYGVCMESDTDDDYVIAFDYYSSDALSLHLLIAIEDSYLDEAITPYIHASTENDYYGAAVSGCFFPRWPIRFEDGLVGITSTANGYAVFYYRTDAGGNPY